MSKKLLAVLVAVLILALALPGGSVSAGKLVYKASLSTGAELHEVVGSSARGSFVLTTDLDGSMRFMLNVRGLSGPVGGAHLHGPATESENAPVLLTLCGNPAQAAVATCDVVDGTLYIEGNITSALLASWGVSGASLRSMLNDGLLYVNVHTALNPAGEARGQVYPR